MPTRNLQQTARSAPYCHHRVLVLLKEQGLHKCGYTLASFRAGRATHLYLQGISIDRLAFFRPLGFYHLVETLRPRSSSLSRPLAHWRKRRGVSLANLGRISFAACAAIRAVGAPLRSRAAAHSSPCGSYHSKGQSELEQPCCRCRCFGRCL